MRRFPAFASYIRTAREAVIGSMSQDGTHGLMLTGMDLGYNTYEDLMEFTGYSRTHIHDNLNVLIQQGQIYSTIEPLKRGGRPRKLFFRSKKKPQPAAK